VQQNFKSSYNVHVIRILLTFVGVIIVGSLFRPLFLPSEFGDYGHYRPGAVTDEANREMRNKTNDSCLDCHYFVKKIHLKGVHEVVSCEVCHGAYSDHVKDGKVIGEMPVYRGEEIKSLCLRCHNKIIRARPPESIKMIAMPEHLEEKNVRTDHACNQCHHVHAPYKWIKESREMMGLPEKWEGGSSWKR